MSGSTPNARDSTSEAVALAAKGLAGLDARAHVFLEDREDLRIRISTDGARESVRTRTHGAAVVGRSTVHRSDPALDELLEMVDRAMHRGSAHERAIRAAHPLEGASHASGTTARQASAWLEAGSGALLEDERLTIELRVVESSQIIWVGRPGLETAREERVGRRVEVRAALRGASQYAAAVAEAVLGPSGSIPEELIRGAVERARERLSARRGSDRWVSVPAVFAPSVAGVVVHELIGHALEGDVVGRRGTRLAGLNPPPLPRALVVVDDPSRCRVPWRIDDEGTPARRLILAEGGRATGVLHDLTTARAAGAASTGRGRRASYLDPVIPRLGCTYLEPGPAEPGGILEDTRHGVYVRRIAAADVDPAGGQGTFLVTDADMIERGRLGSPLAPFPIVLELDESFASLDAIGTDLEFDRCVGSCVRDGQPVAVSVGAPTIRLGVIRALL